MMYALVQEMSTKPAEEQRAESHMTYADIQLLVSGEEKNRIQPVIGGTGDGGQPACCT